jgi:hypothetical protein
VCAACVEQEQGSAFLANLNATPTVSGVRYTVIESVDDEVVTPYTNAFLPAASNVTNITVNAQCPVDFSDHLEIAADPVAMADMLNALDPASRVRVPCLPVFALTSLLSSGRSVEPGEDDGPLPTSGCRQRSIILSSRARRLRSDGSAARAGQGAGGGQLAEDRRWRSRDR